MLKSWFEIKLWKRVLGAMVLGIVVGAIWGEGAESIQWIGTDIFVRLIRMLIIPLIFATLTSGIIAMGNPKKMGRIGLMTGGLYIGTKIFALITGLTLATIFTPGLGIESIGDVSKALPDAGNAADRFFSIIPLNPIEALASGNVLPVIFFSIFLGIGILLSGEKGKPLANLFESGAAVMIRITHIVMEIAPFGVFALMAAMVGKEGLGVLSSVAVLAGIIYGACLFQILVIHGGLVKFVAKLPYRQFFRGVLDAQLVAYSTSSSSATLPVTMAVAKDNLGIKPVIASSVLPLGATINMDGTALYVTVVALFSAQYFGLPLDMTAYWIIAGTTVLVSIGSAGIPSASIFLLGAVLPQIGVTDQQLGLIVGFLFSFDRLLDMMRTVTNITGDLAVATTVAKWEGEIDEEVFRANPVK